jgi:type IV pilus assembly protein PilF
MKIRVAPMKIVSIFLAALLLAGCASQNKVDSETNLTRSQTSAKIHTELAELYYERGQLGVALDEVRQAFKAESSYAPAYSVRGMVHAALREDKEAEEDFRHSLSLDDNNSESHNNYGWFLCQRGREGESIKQFLAALKNPLYATPENAYLNAGLCSQKAGEMKDADEFLNKALLLAPDLPQARLGLAELDFANGDYVTAKSNFTLYAQSAGENLTAENLWMAVRISKKLGDRDAEGSYAVQLRKRFPDARETQLMMQGQ